MRVTHLNGLRALETTLRTGSFRAAAKKLGVTPAAVGQQVRTLENFLGRKLLIRTTTGVQATDHAQRVEQKLTVSFSAIEEIIGQLKNPQPENRLAITLPSSFAENWFTGRLSDFYRLNSEIDLRLDASNRMVDLITEDYDFAIRYSEPSAEIYNETNLFGDFVLPVCTPDFASQYRLSAKQKSLEGIPLIHLVERTPDPEWADWEKWGKAFGFKGDTLQDGIRLTEFNSGLQAAIRGQGLVLCGIIEAYNAIKEGNLVVPFGLNLIYPASFKYRLVAVRGRDLSNLHKQFESWIVNSADEFRTELNEFLSTTQNLI